MTTLDEHKADLADKLNQAALDTGMTGSVRNSGDAPRSSLLGGVTIWSMLAGLVIDKVEAIVRQKIEEKINELAGPKNPRAD